MRSDENDISLLFLLHLPRRIYNCESVVNVKKIQMISFYDNYNILCVFFTSERCFYKFKYYKKTLILIDELLDLLLNACASEH